jgi:hypothetical protein
MFRYEQVVKLRQEKAFIEHEPRIAPRWFPLMYHSTECSLEHVFHPTAAAGGRGWATGRTHDVRLFGQAKFPFYPCMIFAPLICSEV